MNVAALCLGGTLALIAMAYLAAHGQGDRVASATLTNTLIDFSIPGDLGVFTDEDTIARLEKRMRERGYLDPAEMATTFDWMRSSDLIWSYVVNNWFKGKQPPAFDILAWNNDSTRMPVEMHSQYLRACYLHNAIVKPGAFTIDDTPIDLGQDLDAALRARRGERSHRAVACDLSDDAARRRRVEVRADQLRPHRRHRQPAGRQEDVALHASRRRAAARAPTSGSRAPTATRDRGGKIGRRGRDAHGGADASSPMRFPNGEPAPGRYVRNETGAAVWHPRWRHDRERRGEGRGRRAAPGAASAISFAASASSRTSRCASSPRSRRSRTRISARSSAGSTSRRPTCSRASPTRCKFGRNDVHAGGAARRSAGKRGEPPRRRARGQARPAADRRSEGSARSASTGASSATSRGQLGYGASAPQVLTGTACAWYT